MTSGKLISAIANSDVPVAGDKVAADRAGVDYQLILGSAAGAESSAFATAAQGVLADAAIPSGLLTTQGDIIVRGSAAAERLAKGTQYQVLTGGASQPGWLGLSALIDAVIGSTRGQLLRRGASTWDAFALGSQYNILAAGASDPDWSTLSALIDGAIGSVAAGDILYRGASLWSRLAIGSDDQVLTLASGLPSWADASGGGDTFLKAYLTSDQTISSNNTWTSITEATFAVSASKTYLFFGYLKYTQSGGSCRFSLTGPSSPTDLFYSINGTGPAFGTSSSYDDTGVFIDGGGAGGGVWYMGVFKNGTNAGSITLRGYRSTANLTIEKPSWLMALQLD